MNVKVELTYQEKAQQSYETMLKHYYVQDESLFLEHYERKENDRDFSYLWPFSGVLSAANALATMKKDGASYRDELKKTLDILEQYRDSNATPAAYDSYITRQGGGSKFYDDNQWLGLDFVEAYKTLKDPHYLEMAKEMFAFSISGWSDELEGGIYWQEDNKTSKNTCSNGPAAVLAMKIYEQTGDEQYLQWTIDILDWTKKLLNPDSGVYGDNITLNGKIDRTTYTYNTGTIIHANALLYKATKDITYLHEARNLAQNSLQHFMRKHQDDSIAFFPATPWFNVILFKGYLALYEVDPEKERVYINRMQENVDYAWQYARDHNGLFSPDWSGKTKVDEKHKWLLDQAPMVEFYALLTHYSD